MIETYRMLGEERRADLDREAAKLHFGQKRRKRRQASRWLVRLQPSPRPARSTEPRAGVVG